MKNIIRYDRGVLSLSGRKPVRTDDGTLLLDAVFARDGVLDYKILNGTNMGVRRELRLPEENKRAIAQFGIVPVTDEHPPGLLDSSNSSLYRKGITLQNPRYESVPGKGGFVMGQVAIFDSELQERILSGEQVETSSGYRCSCEEKCGDYRHADGTIYRYDAIQRKLEINHQAITRKGRAGSDVCVYLDSVSPSDEVGISVDAFLFDVFDSSLKPTYFDLGRREPMASIHLDGATYEVTEPVAAAIQSHLYRVDSLKRDLEETSENLSAEMGRADALEFKLTNAETVLDSVGFVPDGEGGYRLDMAKAQAKMAEYEEDEEDEDEEDDDEDEDEMKKDSAVEFIDELYRADSLLGVLPGTDMTFSQAFKDNLDSAEDVRRIVTQALYPEINLDSYSDDRVLGLYEAALSTRVDEEDYDEEDYDDEDYDEEEYTDSADSDRSDYASELSDLIANSGVLNKNDEPGLGLNADWQSPLSLSRQ